MQVAFSIKPTYENEKLYPPSTNIGDQYYANGALRTVLSAILSDLMHRIVSDYSHGMAVVFYRSGEAHTVRGIRTPFGTMVPSGRDTMMLADDHERVSSLSGNFYDDKEVAAYVY